VRAALAEAVAYANYHFHTEEALMRRIGFPRSDFEFHVMTHNAFVERINALAQRSRAGRTSAAEEMAEFLTGWLAKHILEMDVKYIRFFMRKDASRVSPAVQSRKPVSRRLGTSARPPTPLRKEVLGRTSPAAPKSEIRAVSRHSKSQRMRKPT